MWEEEPGTTLIPAGDKFPFHHCHRVLASHICITRISHVFLPALPSNFSHIFLHSDLQLTQHLPVVLKLPLSEL